MAFGWVLLVLFLGLALVRLAQVLKELTRVVGEVGDATLPVLNEVTTSVATTNLALDKVEDITGNVSTITRNFSVLSQIAAVSLGGPMVKVASFSYGVRRAMGGKKQKEMRKRVKDQMRAESRKGKAERRKASVAARKAARKASKRR
ncbi:MAG: DUF948 domain-containing protein [Sporichthyaceae bacterium]